MSGRPTDPTRRFIIAALATALLTGLGVGLFADAYQRLLAESFRERSTAYVQAFAEGANRWIAGGDLEILREAARLFLVGSALYVRVESEGELLVDARTAGVKIGPAATGASGSIVAGSLPDGREYLDITVPLVAGGGPPSGYVRVGIDRSSVIAEARGVILLSAAGGIGFDIILIGLLGWALLGRRRTARPTEEEPPRSIEVGPLRIDPDRKEVRVGDRPVRLTPKQFALLSLLATEPGRVFSEEEILQAVWPDSAYADSKDIKQYVYLLRRRLGEASPEGRGLIVTVPGFGYRIAEPPVEEDLTGG